MDFLYPQFLIALALLAIPLVIHLFNFRKFKPIEFSNIAFLKSVKEKTKSQSQLKHLLILLARMLTIAFIVMAFAQPFLPSKETNKNINKQAVSVYIDNSFSMDAENESGRLLQMAQQKAVAIIKAYSDNDELFFIDNRLKPIHQRPLSKEEIINEINNINSEAQSPTLSQIFKRQKQALDKTTADKKDIFIISDFQKNIADLDVNSADSIYNIRLIKVNPYEKGNVYIDSCWLVNPNPQKLANIQLMVRLKGYNISEREVNLTLTINQQQKAIANTNLRDEAIISLNFNVEENGWHNGTLILQDYPITFDDNYHFSFEIKPQISVQHIFQDTPHPSLKKLFDDDDYFNYATQNVNQLNFTRVNQSQFVILDGLNELSSGLCEQLKAGVKNGQSVIIFPSSEIDYNSYKAFCSSLSVDYYESMVKPASDLGIIDFEHILFDDVFESQDERINFPKVDKYLRFSQLNKTTGQSLLSYVNKDSFIKEFTIEQGRIYLSSVGLNKSFSNFSEHALFVPILYNMASYAGGKQQLAYTIGRQSIPFIISGYSAPFKISQKEFEFIPDFRSNSLFIGDQIKTAGHYGLSDNNNEKLAQLALNYDRTESDLSTLQKNDINKLSNQHENILVIDQKTNELSTYLGQLNIGTPLWIYCILLSLLFIIIETLLIRLL